MASTHLWTELIWLREHGFLWECRLRPTASRGSSGVQVWPRARGAVLGISKRSDSRRFTAVCSIYVSVTESWQSVALQKERGIEFTYSTVKEGAPLFIKPREPNLITCDHEVLECAQSFLSNFTFQSNIPLYLLWSWVKYNQITIK